MDGEKKGGIRPGAVQAGHDDVAQSLLYQLPEAVTALVFYICAPLLPCSATDRPGRPLDGQRVRRFSCPARSAAPPQGQGSCALPCANKMFTSGTMRAPGAHGIGRAIPARRPPTLTHTPPSGPGPARGHPRHRDERRFLVENLQLLAKYRGCRVTMLSGDVHGRGCRDGRAGGREHASGEGRARLWG